MNMRQYFSDVKRVEGEIATHARNGVIHVTSVYHRDRNSIAGQVLSAAIPNAARVIADGTHRLSTAEEIAAFKKLQEDNFKAAQLAEQRKRKQVVVLTQAPAAVEVAESDDE